MSDKILNSFDTWINAQGLKSKGRVKGVDNISLEGITRLRQLVMGLALQGKLIENSITESTASEKETSIAKETYYKRLGKNPKKYREEPPLINEFPIPENWSWKRVNELCDLQTGATPSTQKKEYFGGEIPWLVSGDINKGVITECEGRITEAGLKDSNCSVLPKETVLIALNGQGKTRATVALLKIPATCNQSLVGIIPYSSSIIDSRFLLLSLKYRYYEIRDVTGQHQRRGLNMGLIANLSVPLAPLVVQKHIVAKVDELMALCDELEQQATNHLKSHQLLVETLLDTLTGVSNSEELTEAWSRLEAHFDDLFTTEDSIDQLKQTILQLAIMGKLVAQNSNDEPASEFLKKITEEKEKLIEEGKIKKQKPLPEISNNEQPFELPESWEWTRLGEVTNYGILEKVESDSVSEDTWVLELEDIEKVTSNLLHKIRFKEKPFRSSKNKFQVGDVLYGKLRPYLDKVLVADEIGVCTTEMIPVSGYQDIIPQYLRLVLKSPWFVNYANNSTHGMNLPRMGTDKARLAAFPLPPKYEQHRIIAKVDELFGVCDALNDAIKKRKEIAQIMASSVLDFVD